MITKLNLSIPLNALSLGQVSFNILRELYRRKVQCCIFPKGPFDVSAYKIDPQFGAWIQQAVNNRFRKVDRTIPTLSVWHINDSQFKPSDRQYLFTFHETDSPTEHEVNIVNQQDHTFFSSTWSVDNFKTYGAQNVSFIPLGLDEDIVPLPRQISNDITHWILTGKIEQRKNTQLVIETWLKRYAKNPKHNLTLCITNPFFDENNHHAFYNNVFKCRNWMEEKPFNVNVLPRLKTNDQMNQLYNSADIDLSGFSSSEGWNLGAFATTALGKCAIVTDATAHKDWATKENSILVEAKDVKPVYDNIFFKQGEPFSQGNVYSFTEEQLTSALITAEKLAKTPNPAGLELATKFTYKRTVDEILAKIGNDTTKFPLN
jgi:hypothetical protein